MKTPKEIRIVEVSYKKEPYQPFCKTTGCKSKIHAEELARDFQKKADDKSLRYRVALYRRAK